MDVEKTAVIGRGGYIGRHMHMAYRRFHPGCVGTTHEEFDLETSDVHSLRLKETGHNAVLIAAGLTRIQQCEEDQARSSRINVEGTWRLIEGLLAQGVLPIFLSSDYVFGQGDKEDHADDATPTPNTAYGRQKSEIEKALRESGRPFLVVRLSKVFDVRRGSGTLLDEAAQQLSADRPCSAAFDQVFCPTHIEDVVNGVVTLQKFRLRGVVNLASPESWSRYELMVELARRLGKSADLVRRISLDDVFRDPKRPKCTALTCTRLHPSITFRPITRCLGEIAEAYADGQYGWQQR